MALLAQTESPKMLLDNPYVRVVDRRESPRAATSRADRVLVYLPKGDVVFLPLRDAGAETRPRPLPPEEPSRSSSKPRPAALPSTRARSTPSKSIRPTTRWRWTTPGSASCAPVTAPVRAALCTSTPATGVTVLLTAAELEIVAPDGARQVLRGKPFDVAWGTVSRHSEKNLASAAFEVIAVEMKSR